MLRCFYDGYRSGRNCRMGERNLDPETAALLRHLSRQPMQPDCRTTFLIPGHLDLPPAHAPGSRERLHGFIHCLLGGYTGGSMTRRIWAGGEILPFAIREEPSHCVLPLVGQEPADPLQIHEIDSDTDDGHKRDHQNSASAFSGSVTGRYPPRRSPQ